MEKLHPSGRSVGSGIKPGRCILRLIEPTDGEVIYQGENIVGCSKEKMKELRKELQIIFQDPYESLNPRMTVS